MKINLLKYCNEKWILIPPRNTVQEILDIINSSSKEGYEDLLKNNLINDKDGNPDILKATEISLRYYKETEFDFELFECF